MGPQRTLVGLDTHTTRGCLVAESIRFRQHSGKGSSAPAVDGELLSKKQSMEFAMTTRTWIGKVAWAHTRFSTPLGRGAETGRRPHPRRRLHVQGAGKPRGPIGFASDARTEAGCRPDVTCACHPGPRRLQLRLPQHDLVRRRWRGRRCRPGDVDALVVTADLSADSPVLLDALAAGRAFDTGVLIQAITPTSRSPPGS